MDLIRFKIPEIMTDALRRVDKNLAFHCEFVAYMMMRVLNEDTKMDLKTENSILWIVLLHDIGLFHRLSDGTRDDKEQEDKYSHSEYGYLFLKRFTPYGFMAELVRYHHSSWRTIDNTPALTEQMKEIVRVLKVIDKMDLQNMRGQLEEIQTNHQKILKEAKHHLTEHNYRTVWKIMEESQSLSMENVHQELIKGFERTVPTEFEQNWLLRLLVNAIDFRSHYTAIHCYVAERVADTIGKASNLSLKEKDSLHIGIMLHDLGKIAIPLNVLEASGSLDSSEWEIMKSHVAITEELLKQRVDDEVLQVAIRHHETLDGAGYPYGIKGSIITKAQRIAAVADIISALTEERSYKKPFSLEKVLDILWKMARNGKIGSEIVSIVEKNKEEIFDVAKSARREIVKIYSHMMADYKNAKGHDI